MTMHMTHAGAPGHDATADETGWRCACGAGTTWPDGETRPRSRATGGARRHLTAAARNNPDRTDDYAAIRHAIAETADETPERDDDAERIAAARQAADSVRAMFRPATPPEQ